MKLNSYGIVLFSACSQTFEIVASDFEGLRVKCTHIRPRYRQDSYTVESCKNETIRLGGNAFNMRHSQCQVQKCDDVRDPDAILTEPKRGRGWDAYVMKC